MISIVPMRLITHLTLDELPHVLEALYEHLSMTSLPHESQETRSI